MGKLYDLYAGWLRMGIRDAKVRCSQCGHYCDIHRMRASPAPSGLDVADAIICQKCQRVFCSLCSHNYILARLNDACPECGGHVRQVPIWREQEQAAGNEGPISNIWLLRFLSLALMIGGLLIFNNMNQPLGVILMIIGLLLGTTVMG